MFIKNLIARFNGICTDKTLETSPWKQTDLC